MKKLTALLLTAALLVCLFAGCAAQQPTPAPAATDAKTEAAPAESTPTEEAAPAEEKAPADMHVVLLVKQMGNDFWVEMVDSAKAEAEAKGIQLEVLCPLTADSNEEQIQLVEQALLDAPDCFIICPADSEGLTPAIEKLNEAGIPIIVLDSPITNASVETLSFIGSNNYDLGYDLAYAAAAKTGIESGKVAIIEGKTGASSSIARTAGAEAAYAELGWEVVDKQPGNWSRDDSYNAVQNLLQAHSDIDVIQFNSVSMALGAYDAVVKSGQDVKIVAVDKNAEALQLMVDTDAKIMIALIDNPPDYMGKTSVDIAIAYLSGEAVEAEYTTSGDIIAPDEAVWPALLEKYGVS